MLLSNLVSPLNPLMIYFPLLKVQLSCKKIFKCSSQKICSSFFLLQMSICMLSRPKLNLEGMTFESTLNPDRFAVYFLIHNTYSVPCYHFVSRKENFLSTVFQFVYIITALLFISFLILGAVILATNGI